MKTLERRNHFLNVSFPMLGNYKGGLYVIPSFCLMLTINIYHIKCREPTYHITLQFKQPAQIPRAKVVLSVLTTSAPAPCGITLRISVIIHVGLRFTREEEKKTSDLEPCHVAKLTLPNQTQRGYPARTFVYT